MATVHSKPFISPAASLISVVSKSIGFHNNLPVFVIYPNNTLQPHMSESYLTRALRALAGVGLSLYPERKNARLVRIGPAVGV